MKEKISQILMNITSVLKGIILKGNFTTPAGNQLYATALSCIGVDASPDDLAADSFGCMESVSKIIQKALPDFKFPPLVSTKTGYGHFVNSPLFLSVQKPIAGDLMIAVTGTGNGIISNGHIAIVGKNTSPDGSRWAMSNDSRTGTWEVNYTINSFTRYFHDKGGMTIYFFRAV